MGYIEVINLNKNYDDIKVFNEFNCSFKKNQFNSIMGKSGIGKTTLLYILMGLDKNFSGKIVGIKDKSISVIFQENRLLENYSILENINFILDKPIDINILEKNLKEIGLSGLMDKKVNQLSGGMKRRVAILRTVLKDAEIYIFDEPFKNLDEKTHKDLLKFIKRKLENKTVIFSSHHKIDSEYLDANLIFID